VLDRHRVDIDPDPNFHVDADTNPDPDSDLRQNDTAPHADPTPSFTYVGKSDFLNILLVTPLPVYNVFSFS
jgi:hypothetical protein